MTTLEVAEQRLLEQLPQSQKYVFGGVKRLRHFKELLAKLGNPQESFKSIHIAGTSGKGSTAYYMSYILKAHGFKVGTHVSPHIYDLRERFMINMHLIDDKSASTLINQLLAVVSTYKTTSEKPTFYEATVALAFMLFAQQKVDYAVVETGIGGLLDSTNSIRRTDKLAVITKLGVDHTEILGKTPPTIARQKAGIFPENGQAIALLPASKQVRTSLETVARSKNCQLHLIQPEELTRSVQTDIEGTTFDYAGMSGIKLPTIARYQVENACLALSATEACAKRDDWKLQPTAAKEGLQTSVIPARMELRSIRGRKVLMDGAHNPQKIQALISSLKNTTDKPPLWLFAAKRGKDTKLTLSRIARFAHGIAFCGFFSGHDTAYLRDMAMNPDELAKIWKQIANKPVIGSFQSPRQALHVILEGVEPDRLIVITGSIYMIGDLYKELQLDDY